MITLLVARRSLTSGKVAAALLLVDLGCLGIKNAQVHIFKDAANTVEVFVPMHCAFNR